MVNCGREGAGLPAAALLGLLAVPTLASAPGHEPLQLPAWSVAPFVLLLLGIAVLPPGGRALLARRPQQGRRGRCAVLVVLYLAYLQLTTGPGWG